MAHNIDTSNGRDNIAFLGSRNDVWHRLGQEMKPGQSVQDWAKAAGLDWHVTKQPAMFADKNGIPVFVDGDKYIVRSDTGRALGHATDQYVPVQPADVLSWFDRYISVDDRFALDVAGSLRGGATIWATATYNGDISVAGDKHRARVLMTTTFDGTGATINQGTMTRVVCNNTLNASLADKRCVIRTRHNTRFDAAKVGRELSQLATGFDQYKAFGDAMAGVEMADAAVSQFFKACLDIPFDVKADDLSTRKMNQFRALSLAYSATVREGTEKNTAWTALNAVTRYVDHDRSTRNTENGEDESRFASAQFGSGALLKAKAWDLILPLIKDRVAVAA